LQAISANYWVNDFINLDVIRVAAGQATGRVTNHRRMQDISHRGGSLLIFITEKIGS
jgi:hypothetical protein